MKDGVKVRTIEELRLYFDAEKVLMYFINGKLMAWLSDRHYDEYLTQIQRVDSTDPNCLHEICRILEIEKVYLADSVNIQELENKNNKIKQIKQYTDDRKIFENINVVAMNQTEFDDLLNNSNHLIYLCGEKFTCPSDITDITIVGINDPEVKIYTTGAVDFEKSKVNFKDIKLKIIYAGEVIDKSGEVTNMKSKEESRCDKTYECTDETDKNNEFVQILRESL